MIKALIKLAATLLAGILCFIIGKLIFLAFNPSVYSGIGFGDVIAVVGNGFSMDLAMSAYLSVLPCVMLIVSLFIGSGGIIDKILKWYFVVVSLVVSLVVVLDSSLYGYWRFKLDSTPLFYLLSSPKSAMASMEWWMIAGGIVMWLVIGAVFFFIYYAGVIRFVKPVEPCKNVKRRILQTGVMMLAAGVLVISIRGGVTVSTMNLSRAYFSADQRLNHAAVNPAFSLMYSLTHQDNFSEQYRFFEDEKARRLFSQLTESPCDSIVPLIRGGVRPDVYVIILESFSSQLFPSVGGEEVALRLDSIAREGLMFTNFYANSFRTDRGLVSIMSGYPGQPNTSIMKFVSKAENLPSFPRRMKEEGGYSSTYYYGGDANFTNMKAYLVNAGFDRIISDVDFPVSKRLSKWGAHDDEVFSMAIGELAPYEADKPKLKVIQTSSSHEPFEVPYDDKGRFPDIRARAFAYADSCAADFINALHDGKEWNNSLVVIVPDHYGAYPDTDDPLARHKVPLIITGGALAYRGTDNTAGSQIDIASTLLGALRLPHDDFSFSRNLLNPCTTHFAFFADPSLIGMVTESDTTIYNLDSDKIVPLYGASARNEDSAKAFLQLLYDDLSKR